MASESPLRSLADPANKRKRTESETSDCKSANSSAEEYIYLQNLSLANAANNNCRAEPVSQRLILIEVTTTIDKERRLRHSVVREKKERELLMLLPEHIVRQISKYNELLDEAGCTEQVEGDADFDDDNTHDHRAFVQTIDFVSGASLRPIAGSKEDIKKTLNDLLGMYVVGVSLEIQTLQDAVLSHIESCPDLPVDIFLGFAKGLYDGCEPGNVTQQVLDSPVGQLIKRKLEILLPQLLQDGAAQRIKAEGGALSTQLLEVMIEQFSGKDEIKVEG